MSWISKFLRLQGSSFIVLTAIALLAGAIGALMSGWWGIRPTEENLFSFGNLFDGAAFGATIASIGLIPYWAFHAVLRTIMDPWVGLKYKAFRALWVVCWAMALGYGFSRSLSV
ncbi:MAG: hypothetical protein ABJO36_01280 [Litorimonas sp.]